MAREVTRFAPTDRDFRTAEDDARKSSAVGAKVQDDHPIELLQ
ncbi:MAG TPA: hypothetical protein PK313_10800 [Myxococcota bacterium]|nr:hypothetical protein [Myxococcota bacterium]